MAKWSTRQAILSELSVGIDIATLQGQKRVTLKSKADGTFSISGETGKRMTVGVFKKGFGGTSRSYQSFNYAEFFKDEFYSPDVRTPVVFTLEK